MFKLSLTAKTAIALVLAGSMMLYIAKIAWQQSSSQLAISQLLTSHQTIIGTLDSAYKDALETDKDEEFFRLHGTAKEAALLKSDIERLNADLTSLQNIQFSGQREKALLDQIKRLMAARVAVAGESPHIVPELALAKSFNASTDLLAGLDQLKASERQMLWMSSQSLQFSGENSLFAMNLLMLFVLMLLIAVFLLVAHYVQERQITELALAEREAMKRAIVDTAPDGIVTLSPEGVIESANAAMEEIFGYKPEETLGKNMSELIDDFGKRFNLKELTAKLPESAQSEIFSKGTEMIGRHYDGGAIPVELAISALMLGGNVAMTLIIRDITERKEAERRVSEFYSTVSHELRTPLTSIRTALGLMESGSIGKLQAKGSQLVRIARSECDRLIRLINDILDIRKIESGKLTLKLQRTQAQNLIDFTFDALRSIARESNVKLISDCTPRLEVTCDGDRIVQVLTNLISNAVRFSPGGSEVTARVANSVQPNMVRFEITDRGPGIPADQHEKLWDKFQQFDSGENKGGSGLGLAISKALILQHHGSVGLQSEPGKGSTFWFDIPQSGPAEATDGETDLRFGRGKILVVNDDDEVVDLLKGLLTSAGYDLVRAAGASEALRLVAEAKLSLIMIDIQLPEARGFDLVHKLATAHPGRAPLPTMILPPKELEHNMMGFPVMIHWLVEPQSPDEVMNTVSLAARSNSLRDARAAFFNNRNLSAAPVFSKVHEAGLSMSEYAETAQFQEIKSARAPDVVVLDLNVGQQECLDVLQIVRQERERPIPLIIYASNQLDPGDMDKLTLAFSLQMSSARITESEFLAAVRELLDARLQVLSA